MDNMPPLPNSEYGLSFYDEGGAHELPGRSYTADQMHAYARAYAEQRCALLLSALESWAFSLQKPIPDHAHEELGAVMEDLRRIILGG